MRKLASIRRVSEILPIEGADQIEIAKIDGWQCVVKKGEFSPGDLCIYHEIDSFLPQGPHYDFLAPRGVQTNGDGSKGYRLRTIKLRGQLSQGLALPVKAFDFADIGLVEGDDVSGMLGIAKYEPALPAQLAGQAKGVFPAFLKKTDQERIQNMPWVLEDKDSRWEVTQKLDGSSMTVFFNQGEFGVCSRNLELKETEGNSFWQVANRYDLRERLEAIGKNIALQGELIGPGIQGNPHGLSQPDFYLFDIFLIDEQRYATVTERIVYSLHPELEQIKSVPVVEDSFQLSAFGGSVEAALEYANEAKDMINQKNPAPEGVVFKRADGMQSFKIISNKYLLREK